MSRQPIIHLFAVAATVLLVSTCSRGNQNEALTTEESASTIGVVSYIDLEGGFYGIITDDGEHHEPVNLHMDYQVDSLRISYKYETLQNVGSFRMWGTPIKILDIQALSK